MFQLMKKAIVSLLIIPGIVLMMGCPNPVNNDEVGNGGGDTQPGIIDIAAIPGVTAPASGETPVTTIVETAQYTGTVSWSPDDNPFEYDTDYTATITLTAKSGYTLNGVAENFFTVAAADTVSNPADSGVVTAVYQIHYTPETDFTWTESGGEVTITEYTGSAAEVYIPDTFDGNPVTVIGASAFESKNQIEYVRIPDTVTAIEAWAFAACSKLSNVNLPGGLTTIGYAAFWHNLLLESIIIPESVTSIEDLAFRECDTLETVSVPKAVTNIGNAAFGECTSLTAISVAALNTSYKSEDGVLFTADGSILMQYPAGKTDAGYTIPDSTTEIADFAFYDIPALQNLTFPNSVESIGENSVAHCEALSSVTLGSGLTSIGDGAFYNSALSSIVLPASLDSFGYQALSYCLSLTNIEVAAGNTVYKDVDGVLFTADDATLLQYPVGRSDISYEIPAGAGITTINDYAFMGSDSLTTVTIPDSVTTIGEGAFYYGYALTTIDIPASVTSIGSIAFFVCENLSSVTVRAASPPALGNVVFDQNADERNIFVPDENVDDYKTAEKWIDYADDIASIGSMP